jgi:hypothetical protein
MTTTPNKPSEVLEKILEEFIDAAFTEKRLDGNMAWVPLLILDDFDQEGLVAAILAWHKRDTQTAIDTAVEQARIDEREFSWKLINDIRYQNITLDFAKNLTLERLAALQVEQEMRLTPPPVEHKAEETE